MTQAQSLKFVNGQIKEHGLYVVANKIGVQHSTLTRFLHGDRVYGPVTVKIDAYVARNGRAGAASKPSKAKKVVKKAPAKVKAKKVAKKVVKKASKAKAPKKTKAPRVKALKVPVPPVSTSNVTVAADEDDDLMLDIAE